MPIDDFDYGEEPKKGFMGGLFTKKEKPVIVDTRSRNMAQQMPQGQPISDDLMKLLGGQYKGPDDQNMALDYVGNSYVPIGDTYKPIADTYKGDPYVSAKYEPMKYESPGYESASGILFGEQGKAWEDSPVFKRSSPGLFESQTEKSPLYNPTGMSDILFGNKEETPMMSAVTGRPMDFPMRNPASQPFQAVTPVTQFTPSPVNVASMVTPFTPPVQTPVQPVYIPPQMPTMPTQVIPPQYIPTAPVSQFKRPVGRPRLNKPPKAKRPVGRPRMVREETQMTEMQ
jgi:hypothetical protein